MNPETSITLRFPVETFNRLLSGDLADSDQQLIRQQLIAAGAAPSEEMARYHISVGGLKDFIIGTKVVLNADEQLLLNAIHSAHRKLQLDDSDSSLLAYVAAIRDFVRSAYRSLPLPGGRSLDDVFVPVVLKAIQSDEFFGHFAVPDLFRNGMISKKGMQILLQGPPGSGKSTILREIARYVWTEPDRLGLERRFLPMLIRLQSLARSTGATIGQRLLNAMADARDFDLTRLPPLDFFTSWPSATDSKWLLLLDGLDEVPREHQSEIKSWINDRQRSGVPVILTSRPTTALDSSFCKPFTSYNVEAFTPSQRTQLAQKLLPDRSEAFLRSVAEANADFLFSTPLLITLAATIFDRDGTLPFPRVNLYRRIIELWEEETAARAREGELATDLRDLSGPALKYIALAMTEDLELSSIDAVARRLADFMAHATGRSFALTLEPARRLLDFLARRSGVLLVFGSKCDWLHRSFREYLAACMLAESTTAQATIGTDMFQRWNQDSWKQVLLFLLGSWPDQDATGLLRPIASEEAPYGLIFCADALVEGARVDPIFESLLFRKLCEDAARNATGTICVRLLSGISDDSVEKAEGVLRVIRNLSKRPLAEPHFTRLVEDMFREAHAYRDDRGNAAVNDLALLGRRAELLQLASDSTASTWIRHEAALKLAELGETDSVVPIILSILYAPTSPRIADNLVDGLGECKALGSLEQLACDPRISKNIRGLAVDALGKQEARESLERLSNDRTQPKWVRERAVVALSNSKQEPSSQAPLQELLREHEGDLDFLTETINALRGAKNLRALGEIILSTSVPMSARESSLAALVGEKNQDELLALLAIGSIPASLELRVAKAIIGLGDLQPIAGQLKSFFNRFVHSVDEPALRLEARRLRADLLSALQDYEGAIEEYHSILEANPRDEWVLGLRGNAQRLLRRYTLALTDFNAALELDPDDSWDLNRRGLTLYNLGRYMEASHDFARGFQLDPRDTSFLDEFADSLLEAGNLVEAFTISNQSVDADFTGSAHYAYRADIQIARGNFDAALNDLDQAIILNDAYRWAYYRRGFIRRIVGDLTLAQSDLNRALDLMPNSVKARLELACVLICCKDARSALREIAHAQRDDSQLRRAPYLQWLGTSLDNGYSFETANALLSWEVDESDDFQLRFEDALHSLSNETLERAKELLRHASPTQLTDVIIPELQLFTAVFPDERRALELLRCVSETVKTTWTNQDGRKYPMKMPSIFRRDSEVTTESAFATSSSPTLYHPVYCPLYSIHGLEPQKERAVAILKAHANNQRTVVLFTLEGTWIYGQCNFKMNPSDGYDLKFVDTLDTIINRNLKIFADGNVRQVLFVERDLRNKVEDGANAIGDTGDLDSFLTNWPNFKLVREAGNAVKEGRSSLS